MVGYHENFCGLFESKCSLQCVHSEALIIFLDIIISRAFLLVKVFFKFYFYMENDKTLEIKFKSITGKKNTSKNMLHLGKQCQ